MPGEGGLTPGQEWAVLCSTVRRAAMAGEEIITHVPQARAVQVIQRTLANAPAKGDLAVRIWGAFCVAARGASSAVWRGLASIAGGLVNVGGRIIAGAVAIGTEVGEFLAGIAAAVGGITLGQVAVAVVCLLALVGVLLWWKRSVDDLYAPAPKAKGVSALVDGALPGPQLPRFQPGRVG